MGVYKRGDTWWYEFVFAGKRVRESAKTSRKTIAIEAERQRRRELERSLAGLPVVKRDHRISSVEDVVRLYLEHYPLNHRRKSVLFAGSRLAHVIRLLGTTLLPDLTENTIRSYMKARVAERASGRTVNMELGELSRAMGQKWSVLWPKVRKMEERKDVGRALSPEEEARLLAGLSGSESPLLPVILRIALLTGMRVGENHTFVGLQLPIDSPRCHCRQGEDCVRNRSASSDGARLAACARITSRVGSTRRFSEPRPEHCLFPWGTPWPTDPTRSIGDIKKAWLSVKRRSGVHCRFHDLRHTAATKMAEAGVPESTMLAILGHMSRSMLERYSHVRTNEGKASSNRSSEYRFYGQLLGQYPHKSPHNRWFSVLIQ